MRRVQNCLVSVAMLVGLSVLPAAAQSSAAQSSPAQSSPTPPPPAGTDPSAPPPVANGHRQPTQAEINQLRQARAQGGATPAAQGTPVVDPKLDALAQQLLRMSGGAAPSKTAP